MSTTALHIIQLVQSLSEADQQAIRAALNRQAVGGPRLNRPRFLRTPDGGYLNPEGIPNDDPFFKIMEQIEPRRSDPTLNGSTRS